MRNESGIPAISSHNNGCHPVGFEDFLHNYNMDNVLYVVPISMAITLGLYFVVGGFLQWRFYLQQRNKAETWKCQPDKFMSKTDVRHIIRHGVANLGFGSVLYGILATYVINGGRLSMLYFNVDEYGWIYLFFTTVLTFVFHEGASYYFHRLLHLPFFYKRIHYLHHKITSPNAFNSLFVHPFEAVTFQVILAVPMFLIPLHCASFIVCVLYVYYYGMIGHSGIDMGSIWPWQPPVRFHDDHHKYFYFNYGFNLQIFDRYHDTLRKSRKT